ncbi:MAG: MATE family efflux transporter, partial [Pseudomonadota bacterium]
AGFGDVALAANQILLQFLLIAANAIDGFAIAAEALVGQAMGARDRAGLRRAAERAGLWGMVCGLTLAAGFWLAGPAAIGLMTTVPEVRAVAENTLIWMALVPLLAAPAFILDGIFIGATETRVLRNAMLQSFAIFVLALVPALLILGNPGLWVAQLVFFVARGVVLYRRYPALEARAGPGSRHADPL